MSFRLMITDPEGQTSPYRDIVELDYFLTKETAAGAAVNAVVEIHPEILLTSARTVARTLLSSPVGTTVEIPSGYVFHLKEI